MDFVDYFTAEVLQKKRYFPALEVLHSNLTSTNNRSELYESLIQLEKTIRAANERELYPVSASENLDLRYSTAALSLCLIVSSIFNNARSIKATRKSREVPLAKSRVFS